MSLSRHDTIGKDEEGDIKLSGGEKCKLRNNRKYNIMIIKLNVIKIQTFIPILNL